MSGDDTALVERSRSGDRAAFSELVLRHQDRVFNLAYRLTGHMEDAADVAQDAFLKAYRNIAEFHGESSFYTWIYRITVNVVLSRRRYQAVRPKAVEPLAGHDGSRALDPPGAAHVEPVEMAHRRDLQRLVEQAILRLDDESRALIVLRDIEGRNYEEIAEILDCPRGTVKSRLHRARCALRDLLKAALPAGPEI